MTNSIELKVGQEKRRGHRFGIYAGVACLRRFKTEEEAKKELVKNESFYKYWAESISVSVQNTKPVVIWC